MYVPQSAPIEQACDHDAEIVIRILARKRRCGHHTTWPSARQLHATISNKNAFVRTYKTGSVSRFGEMLLSKMIYLWFVTSSQNQAAYRQNSESFDNFGQMYSDFHTHLDEMLSENYKNQINIKTFKVTLLNFVSAEKIFDSHELLKQNSTHSFRVNLHWADPAWPRSTAALSVAFLAQLVTQRCGARSTAPRSNMYSRTSAS